MGKALSLVIGLVVITAVFSLFSNQVKNSPRATIDNNSTLNVAETSINQNKQISNHGSKLKLSWFNQALKDRLDRFTAMFEQSEQKMWQVFNQECALFENCQGLTELFSRYLEYKKSLINIDGASPTDTLSFRSRMDDLVMLREQFFGQAEIEMLFAREQAWDEAALQRLAIRQDENLSAEQKRMLLEAHIEALPDSLKNSLTPTLQLAKLTSLHQQSPAQTSTYNDYAAEFGDEAAQRLMALQQKRANWQQKLADYQSEVNRLSAQYSSTQLTNKVQTLRDKMFTKNEQKRLQVLVH
ncbi:MAG: lipase chaperone [Aliiglaciecola sp.]|uniref:lipase chaperone n=1 Tax=Aliiglaciecola sp. TaxID=1872441 RepID=UPI00329800AB